VSVDSNSASQRPTRQVVGPLGLNLPHGLNIISSPKVTIVIIFLLLGQGLYLYYLSPDVRTRDLVVVLSFYFIYIIFFGIVFWF